MAGTNGESASAAPGIAWLHDDAALEAARWGEKIAALARASRAGLRVPRGFAAAPEAEDSEVLAAYEEMGAGPVAVRGSPLYGAGGATSAGAAELGLADAESLVAARRRVRSGAGPAQPVLVQRAVGAALRGALSTRLDGRPGHALAGALAPGAGPRGPAPVEIELAGRETAAASSLPAALLAALRACVEAVEAAAGGGAAEVDWVWDGAELWVVGLVAGSGGTGRAARHRLAPDDQALTFVLDGEHNPAPLTPATESLVQSLTARGGLPFRMCTWEGWLFATEGREVHGGTEAAPGGAPRPLGTVARPAAIEEALAALEAGAPAALDEAALAAELERRLESFSIFAERYFGATAEVRKIRDALADFLAREAPEQAGRLGLLLAGVGGAGPERDAVLALAGADQVRGVLARFGAFAPGWDLAFPTHAEDPGPLTAAAPRLHPEDIQSRRRSARAAAEAEVEALAALLPHDREAVFRKLATAARAAAFSLEADDLLFARALAALRAPLAEIGRRLASRGDLDAPEDVFFLPLGQAAEALRATPGTLGAAARARAARARWIARRLRPPPARLVGGKPEPAPLPEAGPVLHGIAASRGTARGRACVLHAPGEEGPPPPGSVLVVATASPAWSYLLLEVVALVTEHGGAMSHAAVLAREYGVPAVVGVPGLLRAVRDGDDLLVDGAAGTVRRME